MEWAEDLFTLKKSAKKGRRAAAAAAAATEALSASSSNNSADKPGSGNSITSLANSLDADLHIAAGDRAAAVAGGGRPPRRTGTGWAEDSIAGGGRTASGGKNGGGTTTNVIEQERFGRTIATPSFSTLPSPNNGSNPLSPLLLDAADDDDIPHIPDLDDLVSDLDYGQPIEAASAAAPTGGIAVAATATRVAAYRELNADLLRSGAFAALDGIDLSLLTRCLGTEREVQEPDEVWTWEALFAEIAESGSGPTGMAEPAADGGVAA